jgi:hypothetical protein
MESTSYKNQLSASLGELQNVEGSRIITFDRVKFVSGPLSPYSSREGIIGWNDAFVKLFSVADIDLHEDCATCGELLKSHAGGEESLSAIRSAMREVDSGNVACFTARNRLGRNGDLQDVSVVVMPISFEFMNSECHFLVGFQRVSSDLRGHFNVIKKIYLTQDSPARNFLFEWAVAAVVQFVRTQTRLMQVSITKLVRLPGPTPKIITASTAEPQYEKKDSSATDGPAKKDVSASAGTPHHLK